MPFFRQCSALVCVCVCVTAVFRCFHIEGFSMFSHRKIAESSGFFCSLWKCPNEHFGLLFRDLSHSRDRRFDLAGSAFDFGGLWAADRHRSFASVSENDHRSTHSTREAKNWVVLGPNGQFRALGKAAILAFFLDRSLVVQRVSFVWACSQFWRPS